MGNLFSNRDLMIKIFRLMGRLEGLSFLLLLLVAMPLKYYGDFPEGVKILGPLHGGLFLIYCFVAFALATSKEWSWHQHLFAYVAAVVPCGTFLFERRYLDK